MMASTQDAIAAFLAQMGLSPNGTPLATAGGSFQPTIDPRELAGSGSMSFGMLSNLHPIARAAIAAAGVMAPQPTASDDTISPEMAGARPEHPHSTGVFPGQWHAGGSASGPIIPPPSAPPAYDPLSSIKAQVAASPAVASAPPPDAPAPPNKRIDPDSVDLGKVPRFTTVQYQVPGGGRGGPLSNNPIYTALNLGGQ